ncbi:MAG: hypothetical protein ACK587_01255, partial [Cyanobacteriota bacterium]
MSLLRPHLDILPELQQRLWPSLAGLAGAGFVLDGGTAIALRYGHRVLLTSADQAQTGVKVSFFGGLTIGRVADPDYTLDRVALLASPHDLLATKLKV